MIAEMEEILLSVLRVEQEEGMRGVTSEGRSERSHGSATLWVEDLDLPSFQVRLG
jgi:hypothetical protein